MKLFVKTNLRKLLHKHNLASGDSAKDYFEAYIVKEINEIATRTIEIQNIWDNHKEVKFRHMNIDALKMAITKQEQSKIKDELDKVVNRLAKMIQRDGIEVGRNYQ